MFGHNDNQQPAGDNQHNDGVLNAAMPDPISDGSLDSAAPADPGTAFPGGAPAVPPAGASFPPAGPPADASTAQADDSNITASSNDSNDDLMGLKQQALQHLSPLVSHLDQTPEEKFRTTMMMIQASDDQGLLKNAFEAAKAIADDKARAQALLDVINEINYFTQHQASK